MSLYQCEECGCKENTATGAYWGREKKICSKCDTGEWHGVFPQRFYPKGQFQRGKCGNLEHIETGDSDIEKYEIPAH